MKALPVPAALVVALIGGPGCGDDSGAKRDAGTGDCQVICFACVSETLPHECPSGCTCSFPRTAQGDLNCPTDDGLDCAAPDRTCPSGCDPVS